MEAQKKLHLYYCNYCNKVFCSV